MSNFCISQTVFVSNVDCPLFGIPLIITYIETLIDPVQLCIYCSSPIDDEELVFFPDELTLKDPKEML